VGIEDVLDLARVDVVAAADDQVLLAVDDEVEAVLIAESEIPGVKPAAGECLAGSPLALRSIRAW